MDRPLVDPLWVKFTPDVWYHMFVDRFPHVTPLEVDSESWGTPHAHNPCKEPSEMLSSYPWFYCSCSLFPDPYLQKFKPNIYIIEEKVVGATYVVHLHNGLPLLASNLLCSGVPCAHKAMVHF